MRIAVVTIMKDEAQFLKRWADSAEDADVLVLGDTGSTDDSVKVAYELGAVVHELAVRPWRFDVARTSLLALVPEDVDWVVTMDCDEILVEGWRECIERAVEKAPNANRLSYDYVWSWTADGAPDTRFNADRCHSRWGWRWSGPVHEVLVPADLGTAHPSTQWAGFRIEHYADPLKSRRSYLPLLQIAVKEEPHNPRQRFYLAREYFFAGDWELARTEFVRYLTMPEAGWAAERADAYRYLAKMDDFPERWLLRAVAEDPTRRDAMVDMVELLTKEGRYIEAAGWAWRALRIEKRPGDYMTTAHTYDDSYLHDAIARSGVFE